MKVRTLLAGVFSATFLPAVAAAAVAPPCVPAGVLPRATNIPANIPAFGYEAQKATANDIHLFVTSGGAKTETPLTVGFVEDGLLKVAPTSALVPGKTYSLEFNAYCSYGPTQPPGPINFTATAEAPLPTKIGDLVGPHAVTTADFGTTKFSIKGSYTIAAEMTPWLGVYDFFITLDGRRAQTIVTVAGNNAVDVVATGWCDEKTGSTGTHAIVLNAKLPFTPVLQTVVANASFSCPAPNIHAPAPSNPTVPQQMATNNPQGAPPTGSPSTGSSSGTSSCSVGSPGAAFFPAAMIAVGLAVVFRRRRSNGEG
jgi:hypothetical protein